MGEAMNGKAVPAGQPRSEPSREACEAATAYLDQAGGDPRRALHLAVQDGIVAAAMVSTGYARWGQPARRTGGR